MLELINLHTQLRHDGKRWVGLCPFHQEKTPSFTVNPDLGFWYCYGCLKSGNEADFLHMIEVASA